MGHNSAQYLHMLTESMRRAYRDRALYLGDPEFNSDIPKDRLISKAYAAEKPPLRLTNSRVLDTDPRPGIS